MIRLLDPAELAMHLRQLEDETAAAQIGAYLSRLTNDQTRDLRGLADRLALLIEGGHGDLLTPGEDGDEIDLHSIIEGGAVVLFSLNSSGYGQTAKLIGNMVIQDLKAVCGAIEAGPGQRRPAVVAIDEFSGLDGDQVAGLFQRARSAGLSLMLATQELADLRTSTRALTSRSSATSNGSSPAARTTPPPQRPWRAWPAPRRYGCTRSRPTTSPCAAKGRFRASRAWARNTVGASSLSRPTRSRLSESAACC